MGATFPENVSIAAGLEVVNMLCLFNLHSPVNCRVKETILYNRVSEFLLVAAHDFFHGDRAARLQGIILCTYIQIVFCVLN